MELKSRLTGYDESLIKDDSYYVAYKVASHGTPVCIAATNNPANSELGNAFHSVLYGLFSKEVLNSMAIWGAMYNGIFHLHYITCNRVLLPWKEYYPDLTQERLGSTCVHLPSFYFGDGKYFREERFITGIGNLIFMHPFDFHSSYLFFDRVGYDTDF